MKEINNFKLYDGFGNRIYTAHDIAKELYTCSYNSVRVLAFRFKIGFKKNGVTYFTEDDLDFIKNKKHKAGRPVKL